MADQDEFTSSWTASLSDRQKKAQRKQRKKDLDAEEKRRGAGR